MPLGCMEALLDDGTMLKGGAASWGAAGLGAALYSSDRATCKDPSHSRSASLVELSLPPLNSSSAPSSGQTPCLLLNFDVTTRYTVDTRLPARMRQFTGL